jgi:hypothetical protein
MSNLPVLTQNTLAGLSEGAGLLYLDLLDKYQGWNSVNGERKAFFKADRYERLCGGVADHIIDAYPGFNHVPSDVKTSVKSFIKDRWKNNFIAPKGAAINKEKFDGTVQQSHPHRPQLGPNPAQRSAGEGRTGGGGGEVQGNIVLPPDWNVACDG